MKKLTVLFAALASLALAQNADDYRGGWKTEASGTPRTYEFSIRGTTVRGVYCTWCADATTLAFVDGKLDASGLSFSVTHVDNTGKTTYKDSGTAKFEKPNLVVSGTLGGPGGGSFKWTMIKDDRGPDPLPIPIIMLPPGREVPIIGGRGGPGAIPGGAGAAKGKGPVVAGAAPPGGGGGAGRGGYVPPGPWLKLTADVVAGTWLGYGTGVNKQYFIFKKVGNKLRGMVCGRCDNPYTMAALDDFTIEGEILRFNILHEDWGDYSIPFDKHVTGRVSGNELRINTSQDNLPPELANRPQNTDPNAGTSLIGPIAQEATTLNHWK
ncbi:MAG: hypothetical protein ABI824_11235 [Acidobacteriota bacterium]